MPRIDVSNGVLAAIRARRREAEEPEDRILQRVLGLLGDTPREDGPGNIGGFIDATYGIHFPEGFEISRTYKGRPYAARAANGRWLLDADGRTYDSLNQLSQAVIDGNENAWMFWFFSAPDGTKKRIAGLRDPALIQKRPRRHRRQRGERLAVIPAAPEKPAPVQPIAAPPAPKPVSGPTQSTPPAPALPSTPEPAVGGMAWQPAAKPEQE